VDLRRQSPLVALYKQIQLDAMAAATAADQGAASTRLLGLARSSSHIRFANTSPAPNEEPSLLLETIRRQLSCDSLSPTDAACACVSSHTSSALRLGSCAGGGGWGQGSGMPPMQAQERATLLLLRA